MMKLIKNEDAFTGLEAAIVLIAFIVVAAVFSYVMLGAGFFATQESQRVVHTGTQQASSSLEIIGNIYGHSGTTANGKVLESIEFTVGNTAGGTPIDITQMLVTFVCGKTSKVIEFNKANSITGIGTLDSVDNEAIPAGSWGVIATYNDIGDGTDKDAKRNKLLEPGEQFVLKIVFPAGTDDVELTPNTQFSVNLQPAIGAVYPIKRTVPPNLNAVNVLN